MNAGDDRAPETYDEKWMMTTLLDLLHRAKTAADPDFAACAKLADLILKAQPKGAKQPSARVLEMIRGQVAGSAVGAEPQR